uniref:Uncharacterized protein n=1 Tax=viral metagenome TaxID=1070528 RepID=A0A6M3JZI7_9ZZZZ
MCDDLYVDIENIRNKQLELQIAEAICKMVNAVCKAENINLQYSKIAERKSRP